MTDAVEREDRRALMWKGFKHGAVKRGLDSFVGTITEPICDAVMEKLAGNKPELQLLRPAVQTVLSLIVIFGTAELFAFIGPMAAKSVPALRDMDMEKKTRLLSKFAYQYGGEKFGEQVVDLSVKFFPVIMEKFSEFTAADLEDALEAQEQELNDEDEPVAQKNIADRL